MEFKVIEKNIGSLVINFDELKKELTSVMSLFNNVEMVEEIDTANYLSIYSDFTNGFEIFKSVNDDRKICKVNDAKSLRAFLNKLKSKIDDRKKELKKEFLAPYTIVEKQAKELIQIIDETSLGIDNQIKTKEGKEKELKKEEIKKLWESKGFEIVELADFFNDKWLNKTYSLAQINTDLDNIIKETKSTLQIINQFDYSEEEKETLKAKYLISLNLPRCLAEFNLEKQKKSFASSCLPKDAVETVKSAEPKEVYSFTISATKSQVTKLLECIDNIGIEVIG